MRQVDVNLLGALNALLTERNVTRAAARLHVTQPTMSGMLHRLRYQFGDQLLVRNGRQMELTRAGSSLIEPVREALRAIDALAHVEPAFHPKTSSRQFSIMASDHCAYTFLPQIVARLAKVAPRIRLEICPLNVPTDRLMAGEVDLCIETDALGLQLTDAHDDLIHRQVLFPEKLVCVVANDHPLHASSSMLEYLRYPHVVAKAPGARESIETALLRRHAPSYQPTYIVAHSSMIPSMVVESNIVGIVQERLALFAAKSFPIRTFEPPFAIPEINETLLWHSRHSEDPAHVWLREQLIEESDHGQQSSRRPVDSQSLEDARRFYNRAKTSSHARRVMELPYAGKNRAALLPTG
jgi:LysR family nod box-dependent transcriptional activator